MLLEFTEFVRITRFFISRQQNPRKKQVDKISPTKNESWPLKTAPKFWGPSNTPAFIHPDPFGESNRWSSGLVINHWFDPVHGQDRHPFEKKNLQHQWQRGKGRGQVFVFEKASQERRSKALKICWRIIGRQFVLPFVYHWKINVFDMSKDIRRCLYSCVFQFRWCKKCHKNNHNLIFMAALWNHKLDRANVRE